MTSTSAPNAARLAETLAAPPRTARSASRSSTGTGASGDNRSTEPERYLSSIRSPTTTMRQPVKSKCFMDPPENWDPLCDPLAPDAKDPQNTQPVIPAKGKELASQV